MEIVVIHAVILAILAALLAVILAQLLVVMILAVIFVASHALDKELVLNVKVKIFVKP